MKTYAFIDASNIIYGTRDEGWKVDFKKLFKYLKERYKCKKIYYFGGIEKKNSKQKSFYSYLNKWGFELVLKEVKIFKQENGKSIHKANCDVDLTFHAMKDKELFDRAIFLTGDGDFEILFEYLIKMKKELIVIANAKRTAKEIKKLKGVQFNDLSVLKGTLQK
jgi:uncharacterized LabA/DUF88 family protein